MAESKATRASRCTATKSAGYGAAAEPEECASTAFATCTVEASEHATWENKGT